MSKYSEEALAEVMEFRTIELNKLKVAGRVRISGYVLANQEWRHAIEHQFDALVIELSSHVLGKRETETVTIEEPVVYPSWKHHLIASLRPGIWRVFLEGLWGFTDADTMSSQVTHTITADARVVFPDAEIVVPKDTFGVPYRFAAMERASYREMGYGEGR